MAISAAIVICATLTASFVTQSMFWTVAPKTLSMVFAANAATTHVVAALGVNNPDTCAIQTYPTLDANPAIVPSMLTAPSVPLETLSKDVIKYVVLP